MSWLSSWYHTIMILVPMKTAMAFSLATALAILKYVGVILVRWKCKYVIFLSVHSQEKPRLYLITGTIINNSNLWLFTRIFYSELIPSVYTFSVSLIVSFIWNVWFAWLLFIVRINYKRKHVYSIPNLPFCASNQICRNTLRLLIFGS